MTDAVRALWIALLLGVSMSATVTAQAAQSEPGLYARLAVLRPHPGETVDFEAGYIRHLEWHRQAIDAFVWFGWTIWAGERQRWFVYGTFGHSAAEFDNPVPPADDERDNVMNVVPHADFVGNALLEFLPALSRGNGIPEPTPRVELMTVDLNIGGAAVFERAVAASVARTSPGGQVLWYRVVVGGSSPRYVRLRPVASISGLMAASAEQDLPPATASAVKTVTIELLSLRPTMSYGLPQARSAR